MASASFGNSEFLVGDCPTCAKQVLTHIDLCGDGTEIRRCVHCDARIAVEALKWADSTELEASGYALREARTCGNGGGCGAGGCSTRQ